ncbi:hypothetical protein Tco_1409848 [Tanacetum coccineum]
MTLKKKQISWNSSKENNDDEVNVSKDDDTDNNDDDNDDDVDKDINDDDVDNQDKDDQDAKNPDDDNEQMDSDNNGDDFVHPKFSTHNEEERKKKAFNPRGEEMDEGANNEESERNELYRGLNVNLEGRDVEMTDAQQTNSSSVSSSFVSSMLNPRPDTGIDLIFTLHTEANSLVDVLVPTIIEPPFVSATTLPPPPTPLITHMQQTLVPTLAIVPSSSLIVDAYLANKMHEAVKTNVQLQSKRLRDEAQAKNADFLNKFDDNIKKLIKDQVKEQVKAQVSKIFPKIEKTVNEQLEAEVMTRSSTESKTSLAIAANLSELELKKILIEKMESNKSIHISDEQKNLYKALVDAYESDKLILDTYGDTVSFKRRRDDEDKDEEPSAGSNRGSKRRRAGKEPELTSTPKEKTPKSTGKSTEGSKSIHKFVGKSAHAEETMHTAKDFEEPAHQEFEIRATEDQPVDETPQPSDWFQKPTRLPSSHLVLEKGGEGPHESFDELMDTPLDFSAFMMNLLKVDTLTPELLAGPTFQLMKGTCKSLVK